MNRYEIPTDFIAGRELDVYIAKLAGFKISRATLYSPMGTMLGGDIRLHIHPGLVLTPEQEAKIWLDYSPSFTKRIDEAFHLPVDDEWFLDLHGPTSLTPREWCGFVSYRFDEPGTPATYWAFTESGALSLSLAWLQYIGVNRRIPGLQPAIRAYLDAEIEAHNRALGESES